MLQPKHRWQERPVDCIPSFRLRAGGTRHNLKVVKPCGFSGFLLAELLFNDLLDGLKWNLFEACFWLKHFGSFRTQTLTAPRMYG